jgi:hypothetical protein
MWLLGELKPDHWTICKFRRENKDLIKSIAIAFRKFLLDNGFIEGKTIIFDGSKMKANAARDMLSEKKIASRIANIEQQMEKYLKNADEADQLEEMLEEESNKNEGLKKKIAKLEDEKAKLEDVKKKMKLASKKFISPADPDANLMKSRDGKMACYNIQTGTDPKHHMIAMAEVHTDANDLNLLEEDFENLKDQLGIVPQEVIADKGYANIPQIKDILQYPGTECFVPIPDVNSKTKDQENRIEFIYNQQDDTFICPNGKKLHLLQKDYKKRNQLYNRYRCIDCNTCPLKANCTKSPKGRTILVNVDHKWKNSYLEWIKKKENMEKVKRRKTVVEHPFGTIKMMMGKFCFLLRNKSKVQVEMDIYSTVYNLKRLINIENMQNMLNMVKNYDWKLA